MQSALCAILLFVSLPSLVAQNLETIGQEKPLAITGGLSINQIFYGVDGIESRRDPYTYFASGNVNFSLYGWSVPLSFSLSNQNASFQQPFNQYSLHPSYKWATAHVGYISTAYSPYTVNGHIFQGGAIDLAPEGKWKFSALYGRFLKAVEHDTISDVLPTYKRMGYGFKTTYGDGANFAELVLFHASDQRNSISPIPDSLGVLPQENLVISIGVGKTVFTNFQIKAELATSALTQDTRAAESGNANALAKLPFIYTARQSSSYYSAFKSTFSYQSDGYSVGVGYERVAPQYKTLGAYFFNSDLENITVNGSAAFLQGRMNVSANAGTQRDNLDKSKISTLRRLVGSLNVGFSPSQKLNLGLSYSNFQTYTNIRSQFVDINQLTPYDNLDTLNYTQISQNINATAMVQLGSSQSKRQSLNANLTLQKATDEQGGNLQNSGTQFYNSTIGYALTLVPQTTTLSASFNLSINESVGATARTMGPVAAISKSFFEKKLRTTFSASYNNSYTGSVLTSTILNSRISTNLTLQKKHQLNVSTVFVNRSNKTESATQSFAEFTGTVGYSYSFGIN